MPAITLQEVKFLNYCIPAMRDGEYIMTVQQTVSVSGHPTETRPFTGQQRFAVGGHRFSLNPIEIYTTFPPQGNLGDHANVMPHIVLNRSGLPWEWLAVDGQGQEVSEAGEQIPWMALMILQEDRRWRGTFSKADFQTQVSDDADLWTALNGNWFEEDGAVVNIRPLEDRRPVALTILTAEMAQQINAFLGQYLVSGVEKPGGVFSKLDFQKQFSPSENLWTLLVASQWVYPTSDTDTFVAASPSSRLALATLDAASLGINETDWAATIQLLQSQVGPIEAYLDTHRGPKTVKLADLTVEEEGEQLDLPGYIQFPAAVKRMVFENPAEKVRILDVEKGLLDRIMPAAGDLKLLTHTRQSMQKDALGHVTEVGEERAVLVGNRLPAPGSSCTVYLVSLEARLREHKVPRKPSTFTFDFATAPASDLVRLPVLKQWSFACINPEQTFMGLLAAVNGYVEMNDNLGQPAPEDQRSATLRLPKSDNTSNNPEIEKYLSQGGVPLLHQLRDGHQIPGWYRGPLSTGKHLQSLSLPASPYEPLVKSADELLRFDTQLKMFDTTYAAAWELGRMLMLSHKDIAIQLFHWKRSHKASLRRAEQIAAFEFIPFQDSGDLDLRMPPDVVRWFDDLRLLKHVPFNYLIPHEAQLPVESIRFFQLDEHWVESLIDGAFSIGRVSYNDSVAAPNSFKPVAVSGIVLRSAAVAGWPDLQVDGFAELPPRSNLDDEAGLLDNQLPVLRLEKLSDNVLLVLFQGVVQTVDIHLKPEVIHFGFDQPADNLSYTKSLRDNDGTENENGTTFAVDWSDQTYRVLDLEGVLKNINAALSSKINNSAQLAFYMIEGVPKVRFIRRR
ncbi:MAG: hypothetical protein AAGG75_16845 [Bacteroidota bacterium]